MAGPLSPGNKKAARIAPRRPTGQGVAVDGGAHMQSYARDFMHL